MDVFPHSLLLTAPPGRPLIGNNLVFYAVFGGVLLVFLLFLLWLRRRRSD
jgi:hypothetical protein